MKYKGTQIIAVRIPADLREAMESYRLERNERAREAPWTRSDLIVKALRDFLDHRVKRSRRKSSGSLPTGVGSETRYEQSPQQDPGPEGEQP